MLARHMDGSWKYHLSFYLPSVRIDWRYAGFYYLPIPKWLGQIIEDNRRVARQGWFIPKQRKGA